MSFLSSYKHYQNVSFQPLKGVPFMEWEYAKKELVFASNFEMDIALPELWKFKHNYKKNFTSRKNAKWGILPKTMAFSNIDFSDIDSYITGTGGVTDYLETIYIKDKNKTVLSVESENHSALNIFRQVMYDVNHYYKNYIHYDGSYYFSSRPESTPIDGEIRWKPSSISLINASADAVMTYQEIRFDVVEHEEVHHHPDPDPDTYTYTYTIEPTVLGSSTVTLDCREYTFAKAYYTKESNPSANAEIVFIPTSLYTNPSQNNPLDSLQFAPVIKIEADSELSDAGKRKEKRMVRGLNVDVDSIKFKLENDTIDDFRVTLAAAPDDVSKYEAIVKYFADFFEEVSGNVKDFDASTPIGSRNRELEFELAGATVTMSFNLIEQTVNGQIPKGGAKEYKVNLVQAISNSQFYYEKVKQIYIDYSGVPNNKSTKEMYDDMVAVYRADPSANSNQAMYDELPPADCGKTSLGKSWCYYYGEVANMEDGIEYKLYADIGDEERVRVYNIDSYKEHKVLKSSESEKYHADSTTVVSSNELTTIENGLVCPVEGDPDYNSRSQACRDKENMETNGFVIDANGEYKSYTSVDDSISIVVYKQINGTQYKKFRFSRGKLTYKIGSHTAKVKHSKRDGTFRLFMLDGKLDNVSFKEYTSIFDSCICGLAYVHERVEVKWYQSRAFQVIVAIVAIVITVVSYGSLTELAYSMVVAVAVGAIANYISNKIGGFAGAAIGTIIAIAIMAYVGYIDANNTNKLWLTASSTFIDTYSGTLALEASEYEKSYSKAKKEIDIQANRLMQDVEDMMGRGHSKESIIAKISNQLEENSSVFSSVDFNEDYFNAVDDDNWKLKEVNGIDYNLMNTKWQEAVELPDSTYNYYNSMRTDYRFGDTTNSQSII